MSCLQKTLKRWQSPCLLIVQFKGEPVCWCLLVKAKTGVRIEVVVTDKNAFDLEAAHGETCVLLITASNLNRVVLAPCHVQCQPS
jgi:hypothetical protein